MKDLIQLLKEQQDAIISDALASVKRAHLKHYESAGPETTRQRLKTLYDLSFQSVTNKNVAPLVAHVEKIARERFASDYDLQEVQTAFNVLEEAIWNRILKDLQPAAYAEAFGLISTVLGIGKDTLARAYVALASDRKTPIIDYKALFEGFGGG